MSEKYPTCVHISALVLFIVIRTVASVEVSPHLIEPHAPSGASTSWSSLRTQILEWPSARVSHYSESSGCRRTAFFWAPFSILGTSKRRRELCRDCTKADEAVQSCVSRKIAAQGSMNALACYRGEEASHRLTRNAVFLFSRNHAIVLELQRNILCWSSDLLEQIRIAQHPHNRKKRYKGRSDTFWTHLVYKTKCREKLNPLISRIVSKINTFDCMNSW